MIQHATAQVFQAICASLIVLGLVSGHSGCIAQMPKCYRPPKTLVGGGLAVRSRLTAEVSIGAFPKLTRTDLSYALNSTDQLSMLTFTIRDASGWNSSAIWYRVVVRETGLRSDTVAYRQLKGGLVGYNVQTSGDRIGGGLQLGILQGNLLHEKISGKLLPPQNAHYLLVVTYLSYQIIPHVRLFGDMRFMWRSAPPLAGETLHHYMLGIALSWPRK